MRRTVGGLALCLAPRQDTLRSPDSIQLACAAHYCVDVFITNDQRVHKLNSGIGFIAPLEEVPL